MEYEKVYKLLLVKSFRDGNEPAERIKSSLPLPLLERKEVLHMLAESQFPYKWSTAFRALHI